MEVDAKLRQDAMTSEQVLLILMALGLSVGGCVNQREVPVWAGIYPRQQLWAVVPMRNESGSLHADGVRMADHLANQLEIIPGIDTLAVNRVLAAMDALQLATVASSADALSLRQTLGVDGLVIGTVTAYDPYTPPKLGLKIELYVDSGWPWFEESSIRELSWAAVDGQTRPGDGVKTNQPLSVVSGYFDAADPITRRWLMDYATRRGVAPRDPHGWRIYMIDMDLYTEFVAHKVSRRLLEAEAKRLASTRFAANEPAF